MARRPQSRRKPTRGRSSSPARRARRRKAATGGWLRPLFAVFIVGCLIVGGVIVSIARDLPDTSSLAEVERTASITFYDHEERLIARRGSAHGRAATINDIPDYLVDAVLAVEDRRFYSHPGIDVFGMGRAVLANIRAGRVVQGGSTLTQQLAKNLFLSPERTLRRKAQEVMLAFWLESQYSKDEILELYLNRVYFGSGAWGVEAASTRYFGKPASDLSLGEAALLAGLLKAPSRYSPVNDSARAAARATVVLDLMAETGRISEAERIAAAQTPIRVSRAASSPGAQYFIDWIAPQVREIAGPGHGDLIVITTLDVDAQRAAENALAGVLADSDAARGATEGALVSLSGEGAVRAMVGGRDYNRSQYNRAILASRQPGSAFKPFVYASAFEAGLTPDDIREDSPVRVGDWSPQNYNGEYRGPITLREAFARSSNSVAVRIAEETGRGHAARLAARLGIESTLQIDRSLALGAYEVTPVEMAAAYAPFSNGGHRAPANGIARIETRDGIVIYEDRAALGEIVLDGRTYVRMHDLFNAVTSWGTGRRARVDGLQIGGKTGTTNDFRDAWFAGFGGGLVTVVWTGNDDNSPMDRATGGGPPATVFARYMRSAPRFLDPLEIETEPDSIANALSGTEVPAAETLVDVVEEEPDRDPIGAFLAGLTGN